MHTFKRARSDEQRELRRQAILRVAADMVAVMPVADISLNELSRRVGLAKSNVLRYFESREAVLLDLLDSAWRAWLDRLDAALARGTEAYEAWQAQPLGDYRSFPVPTLFIVGTEDELTLPWLMRATAAAVGHAQLVEIEHAGHSAYAEQADAFNAVVMRFCSSLP